MKKNNGILSAMVVVLIVAATPLVGTPTALAQVTNSDAAERLFTRENNLTAQLRALSQSIGKEMAQLTAVSGTSDPIADLEVQRQGFSELLQSLHALDQAPESRSSSNPEIARLLAAVDEAWPALESKISDAISWGHMTHYEVLQFDTAARDLDRILANLQLTYRQAAADFGVHSVVLNAIAVAEEQRILSEEISRTFFMLAYGVNAPQNRERLAAAIEQFDRDLRGLVEGNPEIGLIPAPTAGIRADLDAARNVWTSLRGSLAIESVGTAADAAAIAQVSELSDRLYEHLDAAVIGLKSL